MFKNNENYIIGYLNRLIHSLITVEAEFELIVKAETKKMKRINSKIENVCSGKMQVQELIENIKMAKLNNIGTYDDKVPQLVSFKISDLIRCKCSSREYEITALFNEIQKISKEKP